MRLGEMVDALAVVFNVPVDGRAGFKRRLQILLAAGILPNANTGKGRRALYSERDATIAALALAIADIGLTPERIAAIVGGGVGSEIADWIERYVSACERGEGRGRARFVFTANGLDVYRVGSESPMAAFETDDGRHETIHGTSIAHTYAQAGFLILPMLVSLRKALANASDPQA